MKPVSLEDNLHKQTRLTLGLMSGTSADGLDIAYCEVNVRNHSLKNLASETIPYPPNLREKILGIARTRNADLAELLGLSSYLGHFYADAIELFCRNHEVTKSWSRSCRKSRADCSSLIKTAAIPGSLRYGNTANRRG